MNAKHATAFLVVFGLNVLVLTHVTGAWWVFELPMCFVAGFGIGELFRDNARRA